MTPLLLGQIFGILTTVAVVATYQLPKRWQIMLFSALTNILSTVNVLLIGAGLTLCMVNLVAVVHSFINSYKAKRGLEASLAEKIIFSVLYFVAWGVGLYISIQNGTASWLDAMPLIATAFFVATMIFINEQRIRLAMLGNSGIYTVYHIIFRNIGVLAQLFNITSIIIALFRYRKKKTI
jgi:hypothetical protein